ncbi:hypothetical protein [Anaerosporobacter faecicola]|uniref:hypothetical protein n=1 Tax=Anaerosporobacter faecicola TaxID=2718714 RepID=UPI001438D191|nr:hypothetical protein [Anaerosporobacter faecicola]
MKEELEKVLGEVRLKDPNNTGKYTSIKIYEQVLPKIKIEYDRYDEEEEDQSEEPFPYIIIKLDSGKIVNEDEAVKVELLIATYDDDLQNQGHKDVLNIINKIYERFYKNPMLANKYFRVNDIDWVLQDDDMYPYYYGAMGMEFKVRMFKKEDRFA